LRSLGAFAAGLLLASAALTQAPATSPTAPTSPGHARTPGRGKTAAPLDFTGVWALDAQASRGGAKNLKNAVLRVRQNGNHIWIEPVAPKGPMLMAEEIVVDGQRYEKLLGGGRKGTVEAAWGKDGQSLWIEAVAPTEDDPTAGVQRMIWRLRDGGKTWTRQTRTLEQGGSRDTFLVFRKQDEKPEGKKSSPPAPRPSVPR
jgi:hypothetical protein